MQEIERGTSIRLTLAEAAAWCRMRSDTAQTQLILLRNQFRSPILKPRIDPGDVVDELVRHDAVDTLIKVRSSLLQSQYGSQNLPFPDADEGKVLIYTPSENVSDGTSEYSSNGFFNENDAPPWDTWFHYSDRQLLSWIPAGFVPFAQKGIDVNMVQCIEWAKRPSLSRIGL